MCLQDDLYTLYDLARRDSMVFNGNKFQVVRYGQNEDIKHYTLYFTDI